MKLELFYPIKPNVVFQTFGESEACINASKKVVAKIGGICPVGYWDLYSSLGMKGHTGEDLYGPHGVPVYATHDGEVTEICTEIERGLGVGIVSGKRQFEGGEYHAKTRYWHLKGINVKQGDKVKVGSVLGWSDNTGLSSGDHLHFELKPVLYKSDGTYYNVFQNNGYFGGVNPAPYWNKLYSEDGVLPPPHSFSKNLQYGDKNDDVKNLQSILKRLGFFVYPHITGYYGDITRKAVLDFQYSHKVITWGIESVWGIYCGPKTRLTLNKLL